MSLASMEVTKAALNAHGVEVFRSDQQTIHLAVRVRSHLMDAGVCVQLEPEPSVRFTVRAQASDYPGLGAAQMFAKVRDAIADTATTRGFAESGTHCREIRDPGDASRVLDVWFELTFAKPTPDAKTTLDEVSWALGIPKCVY